MCTRSGNISLKLTLIRKKTSISKSSSKASSCFSLSWTLDRTTRSSHTLGPRTMRPTSLQRHKYGATSNSSLWKSAVKIQLREVFVFLVLLGEAATRDMSVLVICYFTSVPPNAPPASSKNSKGTPSGTWKQRAACLASTYGSYSWLLIYIRCFVIFQQTFYSAKSKGLMKHLTKLHPSSPFQLCIMLMEVLVSDELLKFVFHFFNQRCFALQ